MPHDVPLYEHCKFGRGCEYVQQMANDNAPPPSIPDTTSAAESARDGPAAESAAESSRDGPAAESVRDKGEGGDTMDWTTVTDPIPLLVWSASMDWTVVTDPIPRDRVVDHLILVRATPAAPATHSS
ncbi:hypothetical protein T484DRAFT_1771799 [Baffinella frigidus]|nr:hypothetical protein T484DRAFT_1771799 [Cryptophyta sp. CCMP2293]